MTSEELGKLLNDTTFRLAKVGVRIVHLRVTANDGALFGITVANDLTLEETKQMAADGKSFAQALHKVDLDDGEFGGR